MQDRAEAMIGTYAANTWLLNRLVEGVTEEEALRTPSGRINSMNWILGHIISGRSKALKLFETDEFWEDKRMQMYQTGSAAVFEEGQGLKFTELKRELERSQEALESVLERSTRELLDTVKTTDRGEKPVWEHVDGLGWHETFHVGQVDILRAFAHKPDEG
jgi:uncharacterized damage-inducible protein DinB